MLPTTKKWAALAAGALVLFACHTANEWTPREKTVITRSDSVMYVTTLAADSTILRTRSTDVPEADSPLLSELTDKMLQTVKDPSQDGVGIAAPQVGLNRRVIWVQRMDKEGEPFECYLNIQIDSLFGPMETLEEGCLSVPPLRGRVPRYTRIRISYTEPGSGERRQETVLGYTARIFQHECDHLNGVLYIDRADTVFTHHSWAAARAAFCYDRPAWW